MFKERHVFFFANFKFNNGADPLDKYFIVLKKTGDKLIIGSLPTRKNKIPSFVTIEHGCVNLPERQYNCYLFQKNKVVCKNDFCFDLPTFIYGDDLDYYEVDKLAADFPEENKHYKVEGELTDEEYRAIINCFINSNAVNRGIQRKLKAE